MQMQCREVLPQTLIFYAYVCNVRIFVFIVLLLTLNDETNFIQYGARIDVPCSICLARAAVAAGAPPSLQSENWKIFWA